MGVDAHTFMDYWESNVPQKECVDDVCVEAFRASAEKSESLDYSRGIYLGPFHSRNIYSCTYFI